MSETDPQFAGKFPVVEDVTVFVDRKAHMLDFKVIERGPTTQAEMDELFERLRLSTDITPYRGSHGKTYEQPAAAGTGYTVIPVLSELWGLPLSDLVLAYVNALRPSAIRVTGGEMKCDAYLWRVTVHVDARDVVTLIEQEVQVLYGCGAEVVRCLRAAKAGDGPPKPPPDVVGNATALARANFE